MNTYYDRQGNPLTLLEWAAKFEDWNYRLVHQSTLSNGYWVSTVWLGLDHSFVSGPPLIFETMVFPKDSSNDLDQEQYSTLTEAEAGHDTMVAKWEAMAEGVK